MEFALMTCGLRIIVLVAAIAWSGHVRAEATAKPPSTPTNAQTPLFIPLEQVKWERIVPDLGEASPEIAILRVEPATRATQLLIRTPRAIHVRKHWHSANETHTMILGTATFECEGHRAELGPGGFNYMPARMVHEAWLSAGALTFITVDGEWDNNWVEGPPTSADLLQ
jgi:mannose-6-phosphate isomerase-like protein (cupin superfamily)